MATIACAKRVGADFVKFQLFDHESLYGIPGEMPYSLPREWLPKMKAMADDQEIGLMVTAFSPELVAVVDPFVSVHKVASSDAAWPQMLEAVAKTGKHVLISFGAKREAEIEKISDAIPHAVAMACVASYPADYAPLKWHWHLEGHYRGFSDHSLGYTASVEAARSGCIAIEKHFTAFPDLDTPDRPHSLTPDQFARMVKLIRGEPVESEEKAMFTRHNRRLIATQYLKVGEQLKYGQNFGSYRSLKDDTRGLSPFEWELVHGKSTTKVIERGDAIGEGDFE